MSARFAPAAVSLKNYLVMTYVLFIGLTLGVLTVVINLFTGVIFNALIKDNIAQKSEEIVRAVGSQYSGRGFDARSIEAMGMYFVHEGYIVTVEDEAGRVVWDARSCDMRQCAAVLGRIAERMEGYFRLDGAVQTRRYPVVYAGRTVGTVTIETYGPFFYSETETKFLTSINRLLLMAGVLCALISAGVSMALSRAIALPINKAGEAARQIAKIHSGGVNGERRTIRIQDRYKTRELAGLAGSINALAEELEEGERRQKRLMSDIAHELRTPLTCLQGDIEAMIDGVYMPDRKRLESCHEEVIRLITLVQDLNTLTCLEWETAPLNKTAFDLAKLVRAAITPFASAALEKGIELRVNLQESPIIADYDRLKQVFINLLSNAVAYTDRGSVTVAIERPHEPFLAAQETPLAAHRWSVVVADTGIGIPADDLPHIFERLYRSDKSRGRGGGKDGGAAGGAGVGLTIAAAIVHAHNGTISAVSPGDGGAGSVFRVSL
ncbi:MAG: HAMP domain-containing histidine kinase [Treponema sp.]|jgi:signal transduction histidine kinase|nr:HAMP domain-containing histidine kinase [Treponema sp.]